MLCIVESTTICFIAEVEKNEVLYNYRLKDYSNKNVCEQIWTGVGEAFNMTARDGNDKWKNLRDAFLRHLRQIPKSGSEGGKKKPYYLAEYLQFSEPFTRSRGQSGNLETSQEDILDLQPDEEQGAHSSNVEETSRNSPLLQEELMSNTIKITEGKKKRKTGKASNEEKESEIAFAEYFREKRSKLTEVQEDADLSFFKSMLPMVKDLSTGNNLKFRCAVLNCLTEIWNKRQQSQNVILLSPTGHEESRVLSCEPQGSCILWDVNPESSH